MCSKSAPFTAIQHVPILVMPESCMTTAAAVIGGWQTIASYVNSVFFSDTAVHMYLPTKPMIILLVATYFSSRDN